MADTLGHDAAIAVLVQHADMKAPMVREAIRALAGENVYGARAKLADVRRGENPCNQCGGKGYHVHPWDEDIGPEYLARSPSAKCPYCNGRGHDRDR